MTVWSTARLALKIVRLTGSAGSLSASASAAGGPPGFAAQPQQARTSPSVAAAAAPRRRLQFLRFDRCTPRPVSSMRPSNVVDQLCRGNILDGDPDGFE